MQTALEQKRDRLFELLSKMGRVAVAFSGGVDSAVVIQAAQMTCGDKATAYLADSPSLAIGEREAAEKLADQVGIRLVILKTDEFSQQGYFENQPNRCFFCKDTLYSTLESHLLSDSHNFDSQTIILNGANQDDLSDHRPGMIAADQHAVRSPLIEAELTKADVRSLAKFWNLPVWDKPASPCLASRVAYGLEVTQERVARIDRAERYLKKRFHLRELRVRHEANDHARIEVHLDALPDLLKEPAYKEIISHLQSLGFQTITLDPAGFRSGSMNEQLNLIELNTKPN